MGGRESADRTHDHHAFDAEIEHTGSLHHQLTGGGYDERRRGGDDGEENGLKHVHHAAPCL
jgi:hypothetical protein